MRCFVAVLPPPEVSDVLARLDRPTAPGVRWTHPDQWHVTLRFLGEVDPSEVATALVGLNSEAVVAVMGPATIVLGGHTVVVPVSGLNGLAASVVARTASVGEPPEDRPFVGHLTLARLRSPVPPESVGVPLAAEFPVGEACLVASHLLPDGAAYEVLERFPLIG
ncbi:MAG: RNA 2',3'-cyclic phosphodiesterase [Acidimicrobiaceae bacterium]|nr:RNA 2',3'-cyclic phosphodiesterase [Acidimicrobiaceae bacterium]|tara:strand:+ start:713 stop:1207 length:495 start_codon:yes stop_codon:yes gene_type:complete